MIILKKNKEVIFLRENIFVIQLEAFLLMNRKRLEKYYRRGSLSLNNMLDGLASSVAKLINNTTNAADTNNINSSRHYGPITMLSSPQSNQHSGNQSTSKSQNSDPIGTLSKSSTIQNSNCPICHTYFYSADTDKSGSLDYSELCAALKNDNRSSFSPETCRMLLSFFSKKQKNQLDISEFERLWPNGMEGSFR